MNETGKAAMRLVPLSARLALARQSDRDRYGRFFAALGMRLAAARAVERELDQLLARSFNTLDYLRTDELGLSKIIADLLDPSGAHGQGSAFLEQFIEMMVDPADWLADLAVPLDVFGVTAVRERKIDDGGRLDISIEFRLQGRESACIAIENKPYAADGEAQIADYLAFLTRRYPGRFLLVYLSPHGGRPSNESLPEGACEDGLATMSYCPPVLEGSDENLRLRLSFSLTDWLRECRRSCDAERLRWFLSETETFCHKTFGGTVTTTSERNEVRDFILASDDNVRTAIAVAEAWPETRNDVVRRFLKALQERTADDLRTIDGLQVDSDFARRGRSDGVWLFRSAWSTANDMPPLVRLLHDGGVSNWYVGVDLESSNCDADVSERLQARLYRTLRPVGDSSPGWPWYRYLEEHKDWAPLVARLHAETASTGELVKYFSRRLVEVAEEAVPIIDEVLAADR